VSLWSESGCQMVDRCKLGNDAAGIARIMQTGWFKEVRVKDLDSHSVRALLASRALLVKIKASDQEVLAPMSD